MCSETFEIKAHVLTGPRYRLIGIVVVQGTPQSGSLCHVPKACVFVEGAIFTLVSKETKRKNDAILGGSHFHIFPHIPMCQRLSIYSCQQA